MTTRLGTALLVVLTLGACHGAVANGIPAPKDGDGSADAKSSVEGGSLGESDASMDVTGVQEATREDADGGEGGMTSPPDSGGGCSIEGNTYASGAMNPDSACQICQPGSSAAAWSDLADGISCGAGEVCYSGACQRGCVLDGLHYEAASSNPNDPCLACAPETSVSEWTNVDDGTACGNDQVCGGGECGTSCDIGGAVVGSGEASASDPCELCEPGVSSTDWTAASPGSSCGPAEVCSGTSCISGCYVAGTIEAAGAANPSNPCQVCRPAASTTAWTAATGSSCGPNEVCDGTACVSGCSIGGTFYGSSALNPNDACESCAPAASTTTWTAAADGAACGSSGNCCSSTCVDESTDLENCGACSHACVAGPSPGCSGGLCNATLATGSVSPYGIAVDGMNVYWADDGGGRVMQVPIGGGTQTTLASKQAGPWGVAVDATSVYWTNNADPGGAVMRVPIGGGAATMLASGSQPVDITVDGNNVYWTEVAGNNNVMQVSVHGGAPTTLATGQGQAQGITVDSANVYWANLQDGTVVRVPIGGGTVTTIASGQSYPWAVAVDSTSVYWTNEDLGPVMKVPIGGGAATTLAYDAARAPSGIALSAGSVYWVDAVGGAVLKVPTGGGKSTTLASGQDESFYIAVDATSIYWTALNGAVLKAPK